MKTVQKLIPVSLYDIPGLEAWLEEQANQGLFPTHLGFWATFEDTGVPGTRFRLEPWGKMGNEPPPEQLELYRQAGWEYKAILCRPYVLFYTTDPDAVELYTDWESRGMSLERLEKETRIYSGLKMTRWALLPAGILLSLIIPWSSHDVQPVSFARLPMVLLLLFHPVILLFLLWAALTFRRWRRNRAALKNTCRALKAGLPPPPSPGSSRAIVREQRLILILIPVLVIGWILLSAETHRDLAIPVEDFSRPYVALQELERVELVGSQEVFGDSIFHQGENEGINHFSLLSPTWYEVSQDSCLAEGGHYEGYSPDPQGGKYRYSPSLDMTCFHLLIPTLAKPVARAQMDSYRLVNLWWEYEEIPHPGLDFVILATVKDEPWQMAAVGKGGKVAVFRYGGVERLEDHLDLLSKMVT
ncbi:DUF2812 domain-containing protein [Lawsonibacter sp. LCP25S3_G6]|uniref:DUF2812 domain-containing protein n=1 Tax=unclassified Lawsonibacter TaxID=2617946 RepID=UPI003F9E5100